MYRLPLRDEGNSWPSLPLGTITRERLGMISKAGVLTHCRLVRPFKCSHTLESQNCPGIHLWHFMVVCWAPSSIKSWLPGILLTVGDWNKNEFILYSLNKYLSNVYYVLGTVPRKEIRNWSKKDAVPALMKLLIFYWVGWEKITCTCNVRGHWIKEKKNIYVCLMVPSVIKKN